MDTGYQHSCSEVEEVGEKDNAEVKNNAEVGGRVEI